MCAIHDNDRLGRITPVNLLSRSAAAMQASVSPPLRRRINSIDRDIMLVLDADGVAYKNEAAVAQSMSCRRVGSTYYTRSFAELLAREAVLHHGQVRPMVARLQARMTAQGCELVSLLPVDVSHWLKLIEYLFNSPIHEVTEPRASPRML